MGEEFGSPTHPLVSTSVQRVHINLQTQHVQTDPKAFHHQFASRRPLLHLLALYFFPLSH